MAQLKIALRVLLFAVVFWGAGTGVRALMPYHWGNEGISKKIDILHETAHQYSVLFIGASTTYRHIIPRVFEFNAARSFPTSAYNLGYFATSNPESHYLLEHLLEDPDMDLSKVKLIVMDIRKVLEYSEENARSTHGKYFMTPTVFNRAMPQLYEKHQLFRPEDYDDQYSFYLRAALERQFNVGMYSDMISFWRDRYLIGEDYERSIVGTFGQGFYSLESDPSAQRRHQNFLKRIDRDSINTMRNTVDFLGKFANAPNRDVAPALVDECKRLIDLAQAKGIHLVFVIPPRMAIHQTYTLTTKLPQGHIVAPVDPAEYPNLYYKKFVFDGGHYNFEGAREYTKVLADELKPIMDSLARVHELPRTKQEYFPDVVFE